MNESLHLFLCPQGCSKHNFVNVKKEQLSFKFFFSTFLTDLEIFHENEKSEFSHGVISPSRTTYIHTYVRIVTPTETGFVLRMNYSTCTKYFQHFVNVQIREHPSPMNTFTVHRFTLTSRLFEFNLKLFQNCETYISQR